MQTLAFHLILHVQTLVKCLILQPQGEALALNLMFILAIEFILAIGNSLSHIFSERQCFRKTTRKSDYIICMGVV